MKTKTDSALDKYFPARRRFLQGAAAGTGAALLGGAMIRPAGAQIGFYGAVPQDGPARLAPTLGELWRTEVTPEQLEGFQRFTAQLHNLAASDAKVQANVDSITKQVAEALLPASDDSLGALGLTDREGAALALAFLAALQRVPDKLPVASLEGDLAGRVADSLPFEQLILAPLFGAQAGETLDAVLRDPKRTAQLSDVLAKLEAQFPEFDASLARPSCYIGQRRVPCWLLVVVVVIIILILL